MFYCLVVPKMNDDAVLERRIAFGQRVRALRDQAGLSQTAMAAAAGMDRSFYAGVEAGRNNVSIDKVFVIADVLGVDVARLFTGLSNSTGATTSNPE